MPANAPCVPGSGAPDVLMPAGVLMLETDDHGFSVPDTGDEVR